MSIKKLIVKEFEVDKNDKKKHRLLQIGEKYSHFQDPITKKNKNIKYWIERGYNVSSLNPITGCMRL